MTDDVIKRAQDKLKVDQSNFSEIYQKARDDLYFLSDDEFAQWDQQEASKRTSTGRPALTIDQLGQFIHQVANDCRMNTPSITIIPGTDGDVKTAEIYQGLIRHIEYASNADDAYDTAVLNSIKCSIGFLTIDHDYESDEGFNQVLCIKREVNPLSIWIDSMSTECDGRDMMHANKLVKMRKIDFERKYPGKSAVSFESDEYYNKPVKDEDMITITEYFEIVESEEQTSLTGDDGQVRNRNLKKRTVHRYILSGEDILEQTTFPGRYIPIVPVYGEECWREGKRYLNSLIRKSKGAQRMFNLWKSLETELLLKQPNAPVMAALGSIEEFAADWKDPSKSMALRYKTRDSDGNELPKPERLEPPTIPTGIVNASRETVDDIKATMGIYNASLGAKSNETSGRAIMARQQEGDVATFHFADNRNRSITHVGRILVGAIPEIYDTARIIHILGIEDDPQQVAINGAMPVADSGHDISYDLRKGQYGVRVITGPAFTTQRMETVAALNEVFKGNPEAMLAFGDIYFKNSDFAGSQALAARAKKMVPPQLLDDKDKQELQGQPDPEKEQMAQIIEQARQAITQLQQENQQLQMDVKNKQADVALKAQDLAIKQDAQKIQLVEAITGAKNAKTETKAVNKEKPAEPADEEQMPQVGLDDDIQVLQAKLDRAIQIKLEKAQADEQAAMQAHQAHAELQHHAAQEDQNEAYERTLKETELQVMQEDLTVRIQQGEQLMAGMTAIQQAVANLTQAVTTPKKVVRNEQGVIEGIQ